MGNGKWEMGNGKWEMGNGNRLMEMEMEEGGSLDCRLIIFDC